MNEVDQAQTKEPELDVARAAASEAGSVSLLVMDRRPLVRECLARCLGEVWTDGRAVPADFGVELDTLSQFDLLLIGLGRLADDASRRSEGRRLEALAQSSTTLVLAEDDDPPFVRHLIEVGVRAHLSVNQNLQMIGDVLRVVHAGGTYFPTSAFDRASTVPLSGKTMIDVLTPRELDILRLVCQGKPNKIIAYDLDICDSTVKVHLHHIMSKLGATNRTQVALMAREMLDVSY
jgi:DNA-binding NarL/FixJ family response regulator